MKVRAILNPRAGVAAHRTREAVEQGRPGWDDYAVYLTRAPGHATDLAREAVASGADVVVAVGGDGTVNEVARGVIGTARRPRASSPSGSGNGLARALRLPLDPARALEALECGVVRAMDVGRLNGRPFLNVAGIGFDAVVGHAFHERGKRGGRRGLLGYVHLSLRELIAYRPTPLALECGGERLEIAPFVVTFANGTQYGSGAVLNPGARLDDGRLEIVVLDARTATAAHPRRVPDVLGRRRADAGLSAARRDRRHDHVSRSRWRCTSTATRSPRRRGSTSSSSRGPAGPGPGRRGRRPRRAVQAGALRRAAGAAVGRGGRRRQAAAASAASSSGRTSSRTDAGAGRSGARTEPPRRPIMLIVSLSPATPWTVVTAAASGASASWIRRARVWSPASNARRSAIVGRGAQLATARTPPAAPAHSAG